MVDLNIFSKRLKEAREAMGYTQRTLANQVGITPASLSAYEKDGKNPSLNVAAEIAKACGVSLDWLCGIDEGKYEMKTYADVISALAEAGKHVYIKIEEKESEEDTKRVLYFGNSIIQTFLEDWQGMLDLYHKKTIDYKLYDLWIKDKMEKYSLRLDCDYSDAEIWLDRNHIEKSSD